MEPRDDSTVMRQFESGATRDTAEGKPEYCGYLSPLVVKRFGEYMLKHQTQADGETRDADNWRKGIPISAYKQSLFRHWMDVWSRLEGYGDDVDMEDSLCALLFNVQGILHEIKDSQRYRPHETSDELAQKALDLALAMAKKKEETDNE